MPQSNDPLRREARALTPNEIERVRAIKDAGADLLVLIGLQGDGREFAIATTRIEEAVMWAVKGITA